MPLNKSPGIDKITVRVIKDSLPATLPVITSIMNTLYHFYPDILLSIPSGFFPCVWNVAKVSPMSKDSDHQEPNNNRPISPLSILSKICGRIALNQIMAYLVSNKCLSTTQSGNKQLHSTETSLTRAIDVILSVIDK